MSKIIDRTSKGAALTQAEHDSNLDSMCGINEAQPLTSYTITIDDQNRNIEVSNASAVAITLTAIATIVASLDTSDFKVKIKNIGAGVCTITCGGADTFEHGGTTHTLAQYEVVEIQTDSTQGKWNIIGGDTGHYLRSDQNDSASGDYTFSGALTFNGAVVAASTATFNGTVNITSTFQISGVAMTATAAELNYNDIATLGTAAASKSVTMSSGGIANINNLVVDNMAMQSYREVISALGNVVTTQDLDFADANVFTATMTGDTTFTFSNPVASRRCTITLELTTGGFTPTWPASVNWSAGVTPPTSAGTDIYTFTTTDGGTTWNGWQIGYDMS